MTKNTSTPVKPPGNGRPEWKDTTPRIARARSPCTSARHHFFVGACPALSLAACRERVTVRSAVGSRSARTRKASFATERGGSSADGRTAPSGWHQGPPTSFDHESIHRRCPIRPKKARGLGPWAPAPRPPHPLSDHHPAGSPPNRISSATGPNGRRPLASTNSPRRWGVACRHRLCPSECNGGRCPGSSATGSRPIPAAGIAGDSSQLTYPKIRCFSESTESTEAWPPPRLSMKRCE